jgi:glucokinase
MTVPRYVGVDVGGTNIRAACFAGDTHQPEAKTRIPTHAARGIATVLERVEIAVREVASDLGAVAGVGIAAPGPLNPNTGIVLNAPNLPGSENLPLRRLMQERLGRPVFVGNDANLAGLGEWKFGAGRGHQDVLYLTISTGIGSGIIAGGRLLVGAQGLAAEVGHMLAVPDGPLCGCGERGHLEAVASGSAIGRRAMVKLKAGDGADSVIRALAGGNLENVTGAIVGAAAQAGDEFARRLITEAGSFIGRTLASLLHLLNPSIVICGGGVSMLGDVILEPIRTAMREHAMSEAYWRHCPVVPAALGDDAGLIGAGALAMEETRITAGQPALAA